AISDHVRCNHLGRRVCLKNGESAGAVGGFDLGAKKLVLHADAIQVMLQALVFFPYVEQHEIIAEKMRQVASAGFDNTRERRNRSNSPYADQPDLAVALDLIGEQNQLRENR